MRKVPVVVTGIGVINALGRDAEEFWSHLVAGRSGVRPATDHEFEGMDGVHLGELGGFGRGHVEKPGGRPRPQA